MPERTKNEMFGKIADELTKLHPDYKAALDANSNPRLLDLELCGRGAFSEADLVAAYAKATGLEAVEEEEMPAIPRMFGIPLDFITYWGCLPCPFDEGNDMLLVVSDPYGLDHLRYTFEKLRGLNLEFKLARRSWIDRTVNSIYADATEATAESGEVEPAIGDAESEEALLSMASEAKIVRLVNEMFARAVDMAASDIHIEPDEKRLSIRFRTDGSLEEVMSPPLSLYPAIASRVKLLGGLNIAERRLPQDGRTELQIGRGAIDVRMSTIPTMNGESIVLRILRKDVIEFNLESIGMNDSVRKEFEKLIGLPHGMVLVVGPTGSGKSTTLYSVISKINTQDRKIITIEDPVEYRTSGIQQIQVNPKIGLDFASGLRHIVRQDPDVILVGEIRDRETAEIAIHAALTGHLVFSTLHTNDATGTVNRLLDMGIEKFLVSSALFGVLSQRLVRKICKTCRGSGLSAEERKCKVCHGRGFRGRIGIFELMVIDDRIRESINQGAADIADAARESGM
ncbi:MAG: type II/IV secretion system protein, partial [Kiritimatiellaeota bacterium]|nr:type II/IV secretion system protein [Kiritimatiellota bacterium]